MDNIDSVVNDGSPSTSKGIKRKQDDCDDGQFQSVQESNDSHQSSAEVKRQKKQPKTLTIGDISTLYPAHFKLQSLTKDKKRRFQQRQETIKAIHRLIFTSSNAADRSEKLNKISEEKAVREATAQVPADVTSKMKPSSRGIKKQNIKPRSPRTFLELAINHCKEWTTKSAVDAITFEHSFHLLNQVAQQFNALEMPEIASDLMQHLQSTLKQLSNSSPAAVQEQLTVDKLMRYRMGIVRIHQNRFCCKRDTRQRMDARDANVCKLIKKYLKYRHCISQEIESELVSFLKEEAFYECRRCAQQSDNKLMQKIFKFWLTKSKDKKTKSIPASFLLDATRFVLEITSQLGGDQDPNQKKIYHLDGQLNTLIHAIVRRDSGFILDHPETAVEIVQLLIEFKIFDWDLTNKKNQTVICLFDEQFKSPIDCGKMRENNNPFYNLILKEKKRLTHSVQSLTCLAARNVVMKSGVRSRSVKMIAEHHWRKSLAEIDITKGMELHPMPLDLFIDCHRKPAVCGIIRPT